MERIFFLEDIKQMAPGIKGVHEFTPIEPGLFIFSDELYEHNV